MTEQPAAEAFIRAELEASAAVLQACRECAPTIRAAAELIATSLRSGGKLLLCGNGGSAADCQHIAAEFVNLLDRRHRRPGLAAVALTTDTSLLTAIANDVGFDRIFERQVEALGRKGDVLIGISTSGNSPNVLCALERARVLGLSSVVLTSRSGGPAADLANLAIRVPSDHPQHTQVAHIAIGHALCARTERALFPDLVPA